MVNGSFQTTEFHIDVEAHPHDESMQLALEELEFFTSQIKILGAYPAHPYRQGKSKGIS